jgi:hypothetical protein
MKPLNSEISAAFVANGAVELYYDNVKKLQTDSAGTVFYDDTFLGDNLKANFGASADLQIYHDGNNSFIENAGVGSLNLYGDEVNILNKARSEFKAKFITDGAVELYHDNSKKFETTSAGADISGDLVIDGAAGGTLTLGGSSAHTSKLVIADNGGTGNGNFLVEGGDGTDFLTINSSGNIFIHSQNSSGSNGRIYTNKGNTHVTTLEVNQNGGSGTEMITFRNGGSQLGTIHQSGSGVSYQSQSDYRLKENDVVISDGITRLKQLRPIRFNWKVDTETVVDGFFAHEVASVVPEAVRGNKDEVFDTDGVGTQVKGNPKYQQLEQGKLIPLLTAALQEAIVRIEALEAS